MQRRYQSWGRHPQAEHDVETLCWRDEPLPLERHPEKTVLPFGNGRSYGDACLNDSGVLIDVGRLDRIIEFDRERGTLSCEAGVTVAEILELCIPHGWFIPVTPGTRFVTLGGAVANDVHGKNHHRAGAFGNHVRRFELARSDRRSMLCSPTDNGEWFSATVGGLGLTGVVLWAEIQLKRAPAAVDVETIPVRGLDDFIRLSSESDATHEYTVAWIDCLARRDALGRGVFMRANHCADGTPAPRSRGRRLRVPFAPPVSPLNAATLKAFNTLYYNTRRRASRTAGLEFFYPLDGIENWNLLYGRRGFLQYQCVVPAAEHVHALLETIARYRTGSFLAVLKRLGNVASLGLMSFCQPGYTLALDFPNRPRTFTLLDELDEIVREAGGAVYPAKDARMSGASFRAFFPEWKRFSRFVDPAFSSSLWRRVIGQCPA